LTSRARAVHADMPSTRSDQAHDFIMMARGVVWLFRGACPPHSRGAEAAVSLMIWPQQHQHQAGLRIDGFPQVSVAGGIAVRAGSVHEDESIGRRGEVERVAAVRHEIIQRTAQALSLGRHSRNIRTGSGPVGCLGGPLCKRLH
jgi:hypothetical protein